MIEAACEGHLEIVQKLLKHKNTDINAKDIIKLKNIHDIQIQTLFYDILYIYNNLLNL